MLIAKISANIIVAKKTNAEMVTQVAELLLSCFHLLNIETASFTC